MISTEELLFRQSDVNRARLIDFLNCPEVSKAFSILTQVPSKEPALMPGVHIDTVVAHEFYKMVGANSILKGMIRMTHPLGKSPEEQEKPEEQPWDWAKDQIQAPVIPPLPPSVPPAPVKTKKK